ncbi:MAG TPA: AMMECR1 domain-containing protein [Nitrospiraceae bacterium]|nr:AMMECR1 domain-containing protein [Nitrospiraceae bacterium]
MHPLVELAKNAVEHYVRKGTASPLTDNEVPPEFAERAGVFVCLKVHGILRGCIGTFHPTEPTIAHETVRNAISAATCDPRFQCVRPVELDDIDYTVDVLTPPEPVNDLRELDPKRYGVIVEHGGKKGLLLPDIDGVDTVDYQISIAQQKAGIPSGTDLRIYRFEVKRYT